MKSDAQSSLRSRAVLKTPKGTVTGVAIEDLFLSLLIPAEAALNSWMISPPVVG